MRALRVAIRIAWAACIGVAAYTALIVYLWAFGAMLDGVEVSRLGGAVLAWGMLVTVVLVLYLMVAAMQGFLSLPRLWGRDEDEELEEERS